MIVRETQVLLRPYLGPGASKAGVAAAAGQPPDGATVGSPRGNWSRTDRGGRCGRSCPPALPNRPVSPVGLARNPMVMDFLPTVLPPPPLASRTVSAQLL